VNVKKKKKEKKRKQKNRKANNKIATPEIFAVVSFLPRITRRSDTINQDWVYQSRWPEPDEP